MKRQIKKTTFIVLAVLTGIYILVCATVYVFQKRIIFLPGQGGGPAPGDLNIRDVYLPTTGGQILHGWWMPIDSSEYTVVFFHGNAGCVEKSEERMRFFKELGYSTLMIDYRGYGKSTGEINKEQDLYDDAESTLKYVSDSLKIPQNKLIIWGWSLGGAVATDLAQNRDFATLVLEGTFYSMDDIAADAYPLFPTRRLLRFHFRSGDKIKAVKSPLFCIHSTEDGTIPFERGMKLFEAADGVKRFLEIQGTHNHGYYEHRLKIMDALRHFLTENRGKY